MVHFADIILKIIVPGLYVVIACRFDNKLNGKIYDSVDIKRLHELGYTAEIEICSSL